LSGWSRTGIKVSSADYNQDGAISYAEAHAFAKVDDKTTDLPVSTLEVWLQKQSNKVAREKFWSLPLNKVIAIARPEQQFVIRQLSSYFGFNVQQSINENYSRIKPFSGDQETKEAYLYRLFMEVVNAGMEKQIREGGNSQKITLLDRLIRCEGSNWQNGSVN
jgi:hypothetical protein